ncbi:biopolymer transporter ExbD [Puniceicoccales bacterium CK1056]|uniref:Biopolymer transporter ExbD n=1 Tax=Oceanipulchritudo coccoides TaxID=2706888 RepID=A0A6B2M0L0_9BACT|nr:biopolymer transporter ExbD [Oceanipulchritudo coccoides]NDV62253.1 biopolymer transporter ExbD [Oceanipulchritudo coccoides]
MRQRRPMDAPEIPIAPMIDCVFLMLVYFMTTSSLEKSEADLPCPVGSAGMALDPLESIDEQQMTISPSGTVLWNGSSFDLLGSSTGYRSLCDRLKTFLNTCRLSGSEPSLRIQPHDDAPYQAVVTFLDAATLAGIEAIHFP